MGADGAPSSSDPGRGGTRTVDCPDGKRKLPRLSYIFAAAVHELFQAGAWRGLYRDGLSRCQILLRTLMTRNGRHSVEQLAEFLGISAPAATKSAHKLQRLGLIARGHWRKDRWARRLSISPKGRRLVGRFEARQAACLSSVCRELGPRPTRQPAALLEEFILSLVEPVPGQAWVLSPLRRLY